MSSRAARSRHRRPRRPSRRRSSASSRRRGRLRARAAPAAGRRPAPDKANILLHGIGVGAQREGPSTRARPWPSFARWVGAAPLVAFHAALDRAMLDRALPKRGLPAESIADAWLDLGAAGHGSSHPEAAVPFARRLAGALRHRLRDCARQAASDTLATAELLQHLPGRRCCTETSCDVSIGCSPGRVWETGVTTLQHSQRGRPGERAQECQIDP